MDALWYSKKFVKVCGRGIGFVSFFSESHVINFLYKSRHLDIVYHISIRFIINNVYFTNSKPNVVVKIK